MTAQREPRPEPQVVDAEEQLRALGQAVVTTDLEGQVLAWNPAAEQLYGWTAAEAVGHDVTDLCLPGIGRQQAERIREAVRTGGSWSGGMPARRRNGTMFPTLVTCTGVRRDGELVGFVEVSTNLGAALLPLLERSADPALLLRSDGVVTYASPSVEQLLGWSDDSVIGRSIVSVLHPEDRPELARFLARTASLPGARPPLEVRIRGESSSSWPWAEASLTSFLDDPVVRGLVCQLRPSPRHTAQEAAETRAAQLQSALDTRLVIEQAKGFLAGRDGTDPEEAFERMRRHARRHHLGIREVARRVLTGELTPVV